MTSSVCALFLSLRNIRYRPRFLVEMKKPYTGIRFGNRKIFCLSLTHALPFRGSDLLLPPDLQKSCGMNALSQYSIPIQGLKIGIHHFKFTIDGAFFRNFEDSPVEEGEIQFDLRFDKRPDMFILDFELAGYVKAECDRCTAMIDLPLKDARELIVKYGETEDGEEDEVVFIGREASEFNVAKYLYEFSVLALPITNTYDCASDPNPPCNFEVLKYLSNDTDAQKPDNVWDALRDFNSNN